MERLEYVTSSKDTPDLSHQLIYYLGFSKKIPGPAGRHFPLFDPTDIFQSPLEKTTTSIVASSQLYHVTDIEKLDAILDHGVQPVSSHRDGLEADLSETTAAHGIELPTTRGAMVLGNYVRLYSVS